MNSTTPIDTQETVDFKVIFNKQKYDVTFPVNNTIAKLKSHVESLTGMYTVSALEFQNLSSFHGKVLHRK